jgi:N-acetylglucosaminyl-diphospho-decaprenol L-rhamnosyltransferase
VAPVTVAVVSWNTRDLLAQCLESLRADAESGLADVWVVDNTSNDGSGDLVESRFGWATLVRSEENLGFGRAVNLVAGRTASEWIAPANADVELRPGALGALVEAGRRHPEAGALAPRLELPDGETQHSVHSFPRLGFTAAFNLGLHHVVPGLGDRLAIPGAWDPTRAREIDWAVGALLLVRRRAWDAAGGFDPGQWLYAEDLDLGWRLHAAGWTTRYVPAAVARHDESAAAGQAFGPDLPARWLPATYAWLERNHGRRRARVTAALNVAGALGRAGALSVPARFSPQRRYARDQARRWARRHAEAGLGCRGERNDRSLDRSGPA